jgi:hypothetical protein
MDRIALRSRVGPYALAMREYFLSGAALEFEVRNASGNSMREYSTHARSAVEIR